MESLHRGAPLPLNEGLRLKTLQRHKVLDTEAEQAFDRITQLAQKLLKAPIVLISLVDAHRQWFKSCIGLAEMLGVKEVKETPRDQAFCAHAILSDKLLVIPDATQDHRFVHNPLVTGPPYIRFYAGSPLETSDGYRLGTLCVIDVVPRRLTAEEESVLRDLSKMVIREMEGRNLTRSMMRVANLGELALECPNLDSIINEAMRMLLEELNLERAELIYPLRPCAMCLPCERCKEAHVFKLSRTRGGGRMNEGEIFSDCHAHAVCESSQTIVLADHQNTAQSTPTYEKLVGEHADMHTRGYSTSPTLSRKESQGEHHFNTPNLNRRKSRNETLMMLASKSSANLDDIDSLTSDSAPSVPTPTHDTSLADMTPSIEPLASISLYLKPTRAPHCLLRVLAYQSQERDFEPSEVAFFNSVAHILTVCMDREFTDKKILEEKVKVTELLLNILPQDIVTELQKSDIKANTNKIISAKFDEATVLFADLVGFTELSSRLPAVTVVTILNDIFSIFDQLAEEHHMEKIKTIGDAYMAASGVPVAVDPFEQAMNAANMALDVIAKVDELRQKYEEKLDVRVGIHTGGPVVAGVIGLKKFCYDLWGDCVNLASRMESTGQPGKVHCTERLRSLLQNHFVFEPRGPQTIKGKGMMETFFLVGRANQMSDA